MRKRETKRYLPADPLSRLVSEPDSGRDAGPGAARNPMTWEKFLSFDRGYLWDYVCVETGLNNLNLANAGYLRTSPAEVVFDAQYHIFGGTRARAARAARAKDPAADEFVKKARARLGLKERGPAHRDTYYGQLIDYAWHNTEHPDGAHFTPIYHRIARLRETTPGDARRLDAIRRRLAHLEILRGELEYIEDSFVFDKIPILLEWTTNRLESYISQSAQLILLLIEYHAAKHGKTEGLRFENMFDALPPDNMIYTSLLPTVDGYLLTSMRNEAVHADGFHVELVDGTVCITIETSNKLLRFTGMREYLQTDVASLTIAQKAGTEDRAGDVFVLVRDPRFSYVEFLFKRSKAGTLDVNSTIVRYKMTLKELLKKESGFVYIFAREMLVDIHTGRSRPESGE